MRPYNFQVELDALHQRIQAEHNLEIKYVPINHGTLKPLLILFSRFLKNDDPKARRRIRLNMLSLWIDKRIESSYELTVYQCSTILNFLGWDTSQDDFEARARRFLDDSQAVAETGGLQPAGQTHLHTPDIAPDMPTDLSSL